MRLPDTWFHASNVRPSWNSPREIMLKEQQKEENIDIADYDLILNSSSIYSSLSIP